VLGADDDVAQLARAGRRACAVDREREHVGGLVEVAVLAVEALDLRSGDEGDREVAVAYAGRRERRLCGELEARIVASLDLDLDGRGGYCWACFRAAGRSPGACFSAYSL
jgi:hypothetical protein